MRSMVMLTAEHVGGLKRYPRSKVVSFFYYACSPSLRSTSQTASVLEVATNGRGHCAPRPRFARPRRWLHLPLSHKRPGAATSRSALIKVCPYGCSLRSHRLRATEHYHALLRCPRCSRDADAPQGG